MTEYNDIPPRDILVDLLAYAIIKQIRHRLGRVTEAEAEAARIAKEQSLSLPSLADEIKARNGVKP